MGKEFIFGFMEVFCYDYGVLRKELMLFIMIFLVDFVNVFILVLLMNYYYMGKNIIVEKGVVREVSFLVFFRVFGIVWLNNGLYIILLDEIVVFGINVVDKLIDGFFGIFVDVLGI